MKRYLRGPNLWLFNFETVASSNLHEPCIVLLVLMLWPFFAYYSTLPNLFDHHRTKNSRTCSLWVAQPYRRTRIKVSFFILTGLPLTVSRVFRHDPWWADRRHSIGKTRPSASWSKPLDHVEKVMQAIEISMFAVPAVVIKGYVIVDYGLKLGHRYIV